MNNMTAVILGLLLIAVFLADALFNGAAIATFLGRRMIGLIEYVAFWR